MRAVPTTYSVTGVANGFGRGRVMDANGGVYSVTGSPTTQIRVSFVNAQPGALTYTGFLATFAKGTTMTADPSTYTHTGAASTSLRSRVEPLFASAYGLTGFESFGSVSYTASLDPGSYTTTGYESTYEIGVFGTMRMWNGGWVVAKPRVYNGSMQPALVKYWDNTEWREVTTL